MYVRAFATSAFAVLCGLLVAAPSSPSPVELHLALEKSEPAAEAVVTEVTEVTLWFTQRPQDETTSIRILNAEGDLVPSSDAAPLPEQPTVFRTVPEASLADGPYEVVWRTMAADGHVISGDFGFAVRSSE
ncbi:MAG: copper resistance protein CopC [Longimicrobiales bacterium]|nr:copper resistance protein CopC [Longimicrobiales bacterium]